MAKTFQLASPLAMGAGHIDPNRALDPGLVYDATSQDYINLLCSMKFSEPQILAIVRSNSYDCSTPSSDLNYLSFTTFYNSTYTPVVTKFHRTVTNVGDGAATYEATVTAPKGSRVVVSPQTLVFESKYDQQSYTLTILKSRRDKKNDISLGAYIYTHTHKTYYIYMIVPHFLETCVSLFHLTFTYRFHSIQINQWWYMNSFYDR
jgi:hypothetical protein